MKQTSLSGLCRTALGQLRMKSGDGELPENVRKMLSRQLKNNMYPQTKWGKRERVSKTRIDDETPVKWLDIKHMKEDGIDATNLDKIVRHEDLQDALVSKKRKADASKELKNASRYAKQQDYDGKKLSLYEITQKTTNEGTTLLDNELKRGVPLSELEPEDQVRLWGKAPQQFNSQDELDGESLAFVLSSTLQKTKKPWEKGGNPYDTKRLKELLENKIQLDKMQSRLGEIEAADDTKLGPEYNYLRLRGKHLFHQYLDRLAKLRTDIMEGLVEESRAEWDAFEKHETKRINKILSNQVVREVRSLPTADPLPVLDAASATDTLAPTISELESSKSKSKKKKKKRLSPRERERRFKEKMEKKEVAAYMSKLETSGKDQSAQKAVEDLEEEESQPKFIWGTLPPGKEHLEYQAHVMGTAEFKGWAWKRPVYYIPRIPWREKVAEKTGVWPYHVDELELPHNWEENYEHFPYYQRQRMWEDPRYTESVPSTEPDWPNKDHEFLDVYMTRSQFTHPGNWRVRLGLEPRSKYTTLRGSIFEDKFSGSPYENPDFHKFMTDPTLAPQHRLGMDILGF
eukprot:TRINITY_DN10402_c0_g1_i2.p1 TRINITY_DN10402_c0_g1~~TRINITY_DN10402_c0_g1_i2.p1  ORF type:complete len:572 (+),score=122.52 TRINITY_DN10402_c0_g1_i2:45-1760(+)